VTQTPTQPPFLPFSSMSHDASIARASADAPPSLAAAATGAEGRRPPRQQYTAEVDSAIKDHGATPTFADGTNGRCPSSAEIAEVIGRELRRGDKAFSELPLHLKDITDLDFDEMDKLPTATPGADADWYYAKSFVVDGSVYAAVVHMLPLREAAYVDGDIDKLIAGKRIAEVTDPSTVIGGIVAFTRAEHMHTPGKAPRRRGLQWAEAVNKAIDRSWLTINTHCPRHVIRAAVVPGTVAGQLDLKECFSMYRFSDEISHMHCFKYKGRIYRCLRMSMGARTASMTASVGTLRICDVPLPPGCSISVCTDNLRCAGQRDDVRNVLQQIIERAKRVGASFNEDTSDIDALIMTKYEFLGEAYDHDAGTMAITLKILQKLDATTAALQERLDAGTCDHRLLSVHLGVLFFVSSTLRVCIFDHHATMQFMRARAVAVQEDPSLWLKPLPPLTQRVRNDLFAWTHHCQRNVPVPIARDAGDATHVAMSDASLWGWACLVWCIADGTLTLYKDAWGDTFPDKYAADSTKAEPEAIYRSLCKALTAETAKTARVIFYSDHKGYTHADAAGYGKCFFYNEIVGRIARTFPTMQMETRFVKGVANVVDLWSRGSEHELDHDKAMGELLAVVRDLRLAPKNGPFARPLVAGNGVSVSVA